MGELFTPAHLLILLFVAAVVFLLPAIFYCLTLQRALQKCAPESRTIEPWVVWLTVVPLVNVIANFFVVLGLSKTLRNEFDRRGIAGMDREPGQAIGLAMAICLCCSIVPMLGAVTGIAHFVLLIIYWFKIAEYSRALDVQPQFATPAAF